MVRKFLVAGWFTAFAIIFWPGLAHAQSGQPYPNKLIRILSPPAGGNVDLIARVIAEALAPNLGQPVVVENRPDLVAFANALRATPDGYTLLLATSAVWIKPLLQKVDYDPVKDLIPITQTTSAPLFLYVHPSLPVKSVRELIAFAKGKPGELNYAMPGHGTSGHLASELLKNMAGIDIVRIAYNGSGAVIANLVSNQVQVAFSSSNTGMPHVATGRLRVLGVANAKPSPIAPDVPTVASSGLPGFEVTAAQCMWVPAHTPKAVVDRLSLEVLRVLNNADVKKRFLSNDTETVGTTSQQTAAYINADIVKWGKVIKEANLRAD